MADLNQTHDVSIHDETSGQSVEVDSNGRLIAAVRGLSGIEADVTADGRLLVSQLQTNPPSTTEIVRSEYISVATTYDNLYTITDGSTLVIQSLSAGCAASIEGSVVELWEDPNGDLSVLNYIYVLFVNGHSDKHEMKKTFIGDGTRRIVMRLKRLDGGAKEVQGEWVGYEE